MITDIYIADMSADLISHEAEASMGAQSTELKLIKFYADEN
jgi:hypothetical protein